MSRSCAGRPIQNSPCFETPSAQTICACPSCSTRENHDDAYQPTSDLPTWQPTLPRKQVPRLCALTLNIRIRKLRWLGDGHKGVIPSLPSSMAQHHILRSRPKDMIKQAPQDMLPIRAVALRVAESVSRTLQEFVRLFLLFPTRNRCLRAHTRPGLSLGIAR